MESIIFLESVENIKTTIKEGMGYIPNQGKSLQISSCLTQGRLFFESAKKASLAIKPILVYYGLMSFSRAVILARKNTTLENLCPSHGVSSKITDRIEGSSAQISSNGAFFDINDVVKDLEIFRYILNTKTIKTKLSSNSSNSNELIGKNVSFKEIISRLPNMGLLFYKTFHEKPKNLILNICVRQPNEVQFQIDYSYESLTDRASLNKIVSCIRTRYPFLNTWCLINALSCYGNTRLLFENINKNSLDDLSETNLIENNNKEYEIQNIDKNNRFDFIQTLTPVTGSLIEDGWQYITEPFDEKYISEFSLYYLGTYILSTIARYHPDQWMRSITHSIVPNKNTDDAILAIIEILLDSTLANIPQMIANSFEFKITQ